MLYNSSGLWLYHHSDWLGSGRLYTTANRTMYTDKSYAALGEIYAASGGGAAIFAGANGDTAPGLYDFMFRNYSPSQGRWISPDPAGIAAANPMDPQTWNRYAYVRNSPLQMIDPTGLDGCDWGDPITCIVSYGNYSTGGGGISWTGGGGPFGGGGGGGPEEGVCLAYCFGRNIVTPIYQTPGGAPQVQIAGPAPRVMSQDVITLGGPALGANNSQQAQQNCLNQFYVSKAGKVTDAFSLGGLLWGPNKLSNLKLWGEVIFLKYGILTGTAVVANKVDTVSLSALNIQASSGLTTTEIASSAGTGMTVGLKFLGKVSSVAMVAATGVDMLIHGGCAAAADPAAANAMLQFP